MKALVKFFIKIVFIIFVFYVGIFSFFMLKNEESGLVYELESGNLVYDFHEKYNFVWHGLQPWMYGIKKTSRKRFLSLDIRVPMPGIYGIEDESFFIHLPMEVECIVGKDSIKRFFGNEMGKGNNLLLPLTKYIKEQAILSTQAVINGYSPSGYNREVLVKKEKEIKKKLASLMFKNVNQNLCKIVSLTIPGGFFFPEKAAYDEVARHVEESRRVLLLNKKENLILQGKIEADNDRNRHYFDKLKEISELIKDNPELLKYIYIDKLSPNIKVIISSDRTGFPSFLVPKKEDNSDSNGDIDNLK